MTEVVDSGKKISHRTRKIITWSALIIVFVKVIEIFIGPFIQSVSLLLSISLLIVGDLVLISLASGFFLFYKEEKNSYLLFSSILVLLGGIINIPSHIIASLTEAQIILTSDTDTLIINILSIA